MARITVEDCLVRENNRFALVQLASKRTKQILGGARLLIDGSRGNKAVVNSLREIAGGKVRFMTEEEIKMAAERAQAEAEAQAQAQAAQQAMAATTLGEDLFIKRPVSETEGGSAALSGDESSSSNGTSDKDSEEL